MENITLELIKGIKDRFKYPIITIYVIVLILWNWDVLSYYLFSDSKIETKINYIEKHFNQNWSRILYPLFKAILLAIVIPGIMLCIEYLVQKINNPRREIKFKNNEAIRKEKLAIAIHEFKIEQERTGKKTIEEWEEKVRSLQQKSDTYKIDIISLEHDIDELKLIKDNSLEELNKKNIELEKTLIKLDLYNESYKLILEELINDGIKIDQLYKFIYKIDNSHNNGVISFDTNFTQIEREIIYGLTKYNIIDTHNREYFIKAIGKPFFVYFKNRFPMGTIEKL